MSDETSPTGDHLPATIGRYQITGDAGLRRHGRRLQGVRPADQADARDQDDPPRHPAAAARQHKAFIERFYQEARISGTLSHPNIVTLFDIGEEGGLPFLAMEFVDGRTIALVHRRGHTLQAREGDRARQPGRRGARLRALARRRAPRHQALEPDAARRREGEGHRLRHRQARRTRRSRTSGALLGTPSYMSPEQAMGEKLDGRSDIFSLGVCAFEMLSGLQPFPGANVTSILYKLVHVDPVEPRRPRGERAACRRSGATSSTRCSRRSRRTATRPASAFVQDLEYCLGSWFSGLGRGDDRPRGADVAGRRTRWRSELPAARPGAAAEARAGRGHGEPSCSPRSSRPSRPKPDLPATILLRPDAAPRSRRRDAVGAAGCRRRLLGPPCRLSGFRGRGRRHHPDGDARSSPPSCPTAQQAVTTTEASPVRRASGAGSPRRRCRSPGCSAVAGSGAARWAAGLAGLALWRRSQVEARGVRRPRLAPTSRDDGCEAGAAACTSPRPPVATGSLRIESDPAGARVRVNGQPRGADAARRCRGSRPASTRSARHRGYEGQSRAGRARARRRPPRSSASSLARSRPANGLGRDRLDAGRRRLSRSTDSRLGRTPLMRPRRCRPGARAVQLALDGHEPWSGTIDVVAGQKGRVEVRLEAALAARPKPAPDAGAGRHRTGYVESEVDVRPRKLLGQLAFVPVRPRSAAASPASGSRCCVQLRRHASGRGAGRHGGRVGRARRSTTSCVAAVSTWRFEPATKRGTRVKAPDGLQADLPRGLGGEAGRQPERRRTAGRSLSPARRSLTIGRDPSNDLVLPGRDGLAAPRGGRAQGGSSTCRDCSSANGSVVNGERVSERALRDGDLVAIGSMRLLFREDLPQPGERQDRALHPSARAAALPAVRRRLPARRRVLPRVRRAGRRSAGRRRRKAVLRVVRHRRARCRRSSATAAAAHCCRAALRVDEPPAAEADDAPPDGPLRRLPRPQPAPSGQRIDGDGAGSSRPPSSASRRQPLARAIAAARDPQPRPEPARVRGAGLAGRPGSRLAAALVDGVFVLVRARRRCWRRWPGTGGTREAPRTPAEVSFLPVLASVTLVPLALLLGALYHVYFWTVKGATPGQGAARPARRDGGRPLADRRRPARLLRAARLRSSAFREPRRRLRSDRASAARAPRPGRGHARVQGGGRMSLEPGGLGAGEPAGAEMALGPAGDSAAPGDGGQAAAPGARSGSSCTTSRSRCCSASF